MLTWKRVWLALAACAGIVGVSLLVTDSAEPDLDENLWQAVAPAVHAHLPTNREVTWPVPAGQRWFCASRPIETRQNGSDLRIGLVATCQAYARRDNALAATAGSAGALVVTATSGPHGYQVREVEAPADGAGHDASLRRMFTEAGYEKVSTDPAAPDPAPQAREAFGLPADAPVLPR